MRKMTEGPVRSPLARGAAAWLAAHAHRQVVLLTDAGLLAIAHDGPAIDALGLGSPDLTEAWANGSGALLESLARRRPLPAMPSRSTCRSRRTATPWFTMTRFWAE